MREREQILFMQTRLIQIAAQRWQMSTEDTAKVFRQYGIADMIEEEFELYHTQGDESVYADIMTLLKHKGVTVHD